MSRFWRDALVVEDPHVRDAALPAGPVAVDVGAGRGALVLHAAPHDCGTEIEIHPVDAPRERTHVAVLARTGRDGTRYAAVFPSLLAGSYLVLGPDESTTEVIQVRSGQVTISSWGDRRPGKDQLPQANGRETA